MCGQSSHALEVAERETGLEPANLDFGKVALYQLSYSRVPPMILARDTRVNRR